MGQWYKDFYLLSPDGIKKVKEALADSLDGAANRADIEKRLEEMRGLIAKGGEDRCHITRDQVKILEGILNA